MHLKVSCPRCESTYQVDASLHGKFMRCPNTSCRTIFEVCEGGAPPPAPPPPAVPSAPSVAHQTGSVADFVPILPAEQAYPAEAIPILPVEIAAPEEPPASATVASTFAPPPVRARGHAPVSPVEPPRAPEPARPPQKRRPVRAPAASPPVRTQAPPVAEKPAEPVAPAAPVQAPEAATAPSADALDLLRELGLPVDEAEVSAPEQAPPAETRPVEAGPIEYTGGAAPPPPVRRGDGDSLMEAPAFDSAPRSSEAVEEAPRKRRRSLVAVVAMLAIVGGVGWAVFHFASGQAVGNEEERYKQALKQYEARNFAEAAELLRTLARDFPKSPNEASYRFLAELSDVRDPIYRVQDVEDTRGTLKRLAEFTIFAKDDPLLAKYHADLHDSFRKLGEELTEVAKQKLEPVLLAEARFAFTAAAKYRAAPGTSSRDLTPELAEIEKQIAARQRRERTVAYVQGSLSNATAAVVQEVRTTVADAGLSGDPDVKALLDRLPQAHLASVKYTPVPPEPGNDPAAEDREPSLLVAPALDGRRATVRAGRRPVLAVARGVLYALEPEDGEVRWAVRVGADTTSLPLWLPRTEVAPESVLVLSSDSQTLASLDAATGATRWRRRLSAPCLGRPVLLGSRAFVPSYNGRVEEIEVNGGALLGHYDLGQPLTVGGAHQPGTSLIYFPADNFCVYVLDVARRACVAVLYSGHPSGSLRGPPLVLAAEAVAALPGKTSGYLLLNQADGLEAMRVRAFALPVATADAPALQPEPRLDGWAWFPPYTDGEKLALVTDAGAFALYGIEPRAGRSPFVTLFTEKLAQAAAGRAYSGRAQLVHADGRQFWVLAHGGLYRLETSFTRESGPRLSPPGPALLEVGSPLHSSQVRVNDRGETTLFLTTQSAGGQDCLVTAVDAGAGEVRWQRQLGLVTRGQPVAVGGRILAQDLGGGLFLFDADKVPDAAGRLWCLGGRKFSGPPATEDGAFHLLTTPGGEKAYAVAVTRQDSGPVLTVREFVQGKEPEAPRTFPLQAPLAGTPAVVGDALVLPLNNGILVRQPLAGGAASTGPNWRAAHADEHATGHVVPLNAEEFLVTDGSRGLRRMGTDGKVWETKASVELPERIVSPPVVLPAGEGGELRVCVADTANTVTLLRGDELRAARRWTMSGRITAGPFARGAGVGCVLEHRRLVWLDPEQIKPLWGVDFRGDVVGQPELVGGVLVVADQRGQIQGLDPATGQPRGTGYTLKANVAPTAAPVAFGADRLFAPLTDGTVLLLSRKYLAAPAR